MTYCYECGSPLELKIPEGDDQQREVCSGCGHIHYQNPCMLVGAFLYHEDKILWIKRGTQPNKGKWTFPAGFLEQGESLQQAASRELFEETRIKIEPQRMIPFGMLSLMVMGQVYLSFRCRCDTPIDAEITEEVADWGWFTEDDAPWDELAYPNTMEQVRETYKLLRERQFPIRVGEITEQGIVFNIYQSDY